MTPELVVLGNLLVDDLVFPDGRTRMGQPGGATLYAALGAALSGARVGLVSWRGDDYPAAQLEALGARGIDLAGVQALGRPGVRTWLLYEGARRQVLHRLDRPSHTEVSPTAALGLEFRESLTNLTKRVDCIDLRFFVTAVILQRDTGGNLAEVLENTSRLIRDRFRVLGDIRTFTAQGRLTGWILLSLPISISVFSVAVAPDYFRPMMASDGGRVALWIAGLMQLAGALVIRKIVNVRV